MVAWVDGESLDYYALRVVVGKERVTCDILQNRNILARVPMVKFTPKSRYVSRCIPRDRPTFAGMAFVAFPKGLTDLPWFAIKKLHTVLGVIGMDHRPKKCDAAGLLNLFDNIVFTTAEVAKHVRVYGKTDRVKILGGALAGFEAEVTEATSDELRLLCDCKIFGCQIPVRLNKNQLDMIEPLAVAAA